MSLFRVIIRKVKLWIYLGRSYYHISGHKAVFPFGCSSSHPFSQLCQVSYHPGNWWTLGQLSWASEIQWFIPVRKAFSWQVVFGLFLIIKFSHSFTTWANASLVGQMDFNWKQRNKALNLVIFSWHNFYKGRKEEKTFIQKLPLLSRCLWGLLKTLVNERKIQLHFALCFLLPHYRRLWKRKCRLSLSKPSS